MWARARAGHCHRVSVARFARAERELAARGAPAAQEELNIDSHHILKQHARPIQGGGVAADVALQGGQWPPLLVARRLPPTPGQHTYTHTHTHTLSALGPS